MVPERTCAKCHDDLARFPVTATSTKSNTNASSSSSSSSQSDGSTSAPGGPQAPSFVCKCGMPLCICAEAARKPTTSSSTTVRSPAAGSTSGPSPSSNTADRPAAGPSQTTVNRPFQSFNSQFQSFASASKQSYNLNGNLEEQCREAIKAGDYEGVQQLIAAKANVNYCDRTGNTLLHIACIMGKYNIVRELCLNGANPYIPSAATSQAETAFSLAPPSLQYKIKEQWPESLYQQR